MSDALPIDKFNAKPRPRPAERFPATVGRFADANDRLIVDSLVRWVEDQYREDLKKRPSKHVYIDKLPVEVTAQVEALRGSEAIRAAMLRHFDANSVITPMRHTDELYISHYNKDLGGDQGLYSRHYDGNLRFVPFGTVVRALIYLQSDATYKVVFGDSKVERAFVTYEFGLLDFHRELHWVEGEYNPDDQQRILLKCNYLVTPKDTEILSAMVLGANTAVFYIVKAAMEYSKSPATLAQFLVGLTCNAMRILNNIHPLVPLGLVAALAGASAWGLLLFF